MLPSYPPSQGLSISKRGKFSVWCLQGAVAEASFMTGMERNSDIVKLASYAPLFVHTQNRIWPTNMIVIDNHRCLPLPPLFLLKSPSKCEKSAAAPIPIQEA